MQTRPNMMLNKPMAIKKKAKTPSQYPVKAKCFSDLALMINNKKKSNKMVDLRANCSLSTWP